MSEDERRDLGENCKQWGGHGRKKTYSANQQQLRLRLVRDPEILILVAIPAWGNGSVSWCIVQGYSKTPFTSTLPWKSACFLSQFLVSGGIVCHKVVGVTRWSLEGRAGDTDELDSNNELKEHLNHLGFLEISKLSKVGEFSSNSLPG